MPIDVDIKQLDDGDGIEATLMRHHAGWHKTFNQNNYKKSIGTSAVHTCSSHSSIDLKDDKCFLCNKPAGSEGLHNASTYDIDAMCNQAALLAKLEPGDMIVLKAKYH